ncbi:hypothetical protein HHK36_002589 [Tetracentron sinense]|uniref:Uncharacterized protein n=1 Tax=Tetracentron sinense TaxID=13715 RepID=A0A834ZPP3_TETSI|nr:hypothetical protein HHK36_002589 [Tetracentron sinense]
MSFPFYRKPSLQLRFRALETGSDGGRIGSQDAYGSDLLRKPSILPVDEVEVPTKKGDFTGLSDDDDVEGKRSYKQREEEEWVDWEDQILEDTVPLVGFVKMILHSGKDETLLLLLKAQEAKATGYGRNMQVVSLLQFPELKKRWEKRSEKGIGSENNEVEMVGRSRCCDLSEMKTTLAMELKGDEARDALLD